MLLLLDGTRDRAAIVRDMGLDDMAPVDDALERLASVALLTPAP